MAQFYGKITILLGLGIEIRMPESIKKIGSAVYVANHQNSWDMITVASALPLNTVTVGKKSLKWIPFFGQMYWLSGNILIDRKNSSKAMNTIAHTASKIIEEKFSVFLFPEGTRSYGRQMLSFKTGAFRTAAQAEVPVVPVCASNTHDINLNRWDNGKLIIQFMEPIEIDINDNFRKVANNTREKMLAKFIELNKETGSELNVTNEKNKGS